MKKNVFFTEEEAGEKVGKEVMAKKSFLDVRPGTKGVVDEIMKLPNGCCVMVSWEGAEIAMALTKNEYEGLIEEKPILINYNKDSSFSFPEASKQGKN